MLPGIPELSTGNAFELLGSVTGSSVPVQTTLATFLVVLARMMGFIVVAPFFGSMNIPMVARVGMATILTAVVTPLVAGSASVALLTKPSGMEFLLLLTNQVLIGLMFGFIGAFVFYGIESAGRIIDTQRGSNITDIIAPQTGDRTSPTGQWLMMFALMILLMSGQHMMMLESLVRTFEIFPPTGSLDWIGDPGRNGQMSDVLTRFVDLSSESLLITLQVAAPAMISLTLADVMLGIINRGAPQVNVFALSQVIKGPIGIGGVLVALGSIAAFIETGAIRSIWRGDGSILHIAELMSKGASGG